MKMKRIFLKLSGEALAGPKKAGFDRDAVKEAARQVKLPVGVGIQAGIIISGGNFWRGRISETIGRTRTDQTGMLATVMDCVYISEIFRSAGMITQILMSFTCGSMTKLLSKDRTNRYFGRDMVVFFAGGTSHPYLSTDTGVAPGAIEMEVDYALLVKAIDGVYDSDPKLNPEAKKYNTISIQGVIGKQLVVADLATSIMCMGYKMPMAVFSLNEKNGIADAIWDRINGTVVTA